MKLLDFLNIGRTIGRILLLLFCFILYPSSTFGQNGSFVDRYNLHFQLVDSIGVGIWTPDSKFLSPLSRDSTLYNGKYPLKIGRLYIKNIFTSPLETYLRQNIPICTADAKEASISITLKTENLVKGELVVSGMDQFENVLYTKRLPILAEYSWSTYASQYPLKNVAMLNVSINLFGGADSLLQMAWLDRLEMKVDGKEPEVCDDSPPFSYPPVSTLTTYPLSLSSPDTYQSIPDIRQHSVLAIGESIHGSQTMNGIGFDFMRHCIEKEGARLALLELPLERMLAVNRYIQGDERFKLDELLKKEEQSLFSNKKLGDFLNWLKTYNHDKKQKVWLLGLDQAPTLISQMELFDYFYTINQTAQLPILDSLCVGLFQKRPFNELAEMMRTEPALRTLFPEAEYQLLLHCLAPFAYDSKAFTTGNSPRDHIMFLNTNFLIHAICKNREKTVIYAHLSHVNYSSQTPTYFESASFGSYLKKAYPDYFCIGLFAGEGKCLLRSGRFANGFVEHSLPENRTSSLEGSLLQSPTDYFYVSSLPSQLSFSRLIGSANYLYPQAISNLANRIGGLLFIKQSEAIDLDQTRLDTELFAADWLKRMEEYRNRYQRICKLQ